MSIQALATTRVEGRTAVNRSRTAGMAGLTFGLLLILQNVIRSAGAPANDAPAADVLRYVTANHTALEFLLALFVPGFVALFWFVSGLMATVRSAGADGPWATFGFVGVVIIGALFALSNGVEAAIVALAPRLDGQTGVVDALWALHGAFFALNEMAIGAALLGLSRASIGAGVTPRSLNWLVVGGALLLFAGAVPVVAVTAGSPLFYLPLPGFVIWIIWLVVTSVNLLRDRQPA